MRSNSINHTETTSETQNHTPQSLQNIILALIAREDLHSSRSMIQDESLQTPHFKTSLIKSTPFIKLLPVELQYRIISFLSRNDWTSLLRVNKEWREVTIAAANTYLNSISEHDLIPKIDFDDTMKKLLYVVNHYYEETQKCYTEVCAVRQLVNEINKLTKPLAKLFHFHKKINEIQPMMKENSLQARYYYRLMLFKGSSQFHMMLYPYWEKSKKLVQEDQLVKAKLYTKFSPEHPITKLFSDAYIELKTLTSETSNEDRSNEDRSNEDRSNEDRSNEDRSNNECKMQ